jgi:plastocyanin
MVAIVAVLALGGAVTAYRTGSTGDAGFRATRIAAPAIAPTGGDEQPAVEECRVLPSDPARLRLTGKTRTASIVPPVPEPRPGAGVRSVRYRDLPVGGPVPEGAVQGVTDTVRKLTACFNAGDLARYSALFSDDFWRRANRDGGSPILDLHGRRTNDVRATPVIDVPVGADYRFRAPAPVGPDFMHRMPIVAEHRRLDDGRVGAIVILESRFGDPEYLDLGSPPLFVTFVRQGGRWLIDDVVGIQNGIAVMAQDGRDALDLASLETGEGMAVMFVVRNRGNEPSRFEIEAVAAPLTVVPGGTGVLIVEPPAGRYTFRGSFLSAGTPVADSSGSLLINPVGSEAPVSPVPSNRPSVDIETVDLAFRPDVVRIPAGTDVVLRLRHAAGSAVHNFTIDALGVSVDLEPGQTREITVNAPPAEYEFYSALPGHADAGMTGRLIVADGSVATPATAPGDAATPPA